MRTALTLTFLAVVASLFQGCSKESNGASTELAITQSNPVATVRGGEAKPSSILYRPSAATTASKLYAPGEAEAAYEEAAKILSSLSGAANYERDSIVTKGLAPLSRSLELSASRLKSDPQAPDLLRLVKIDPRFAHARLVPKYERLLVSSPQAPMALPYSGLTVTVADVSSSKPVIAQQTQRGPIATVSRPGPDEARSVVEGVGVAVGTAVGDMQKEDKLKRKLQELLDVALKTENRNPVFALNPTDELEVKAAKVFLSDAFAGLLGATTFYKDSYFYAYEPQTNLIMIVQFKSPIAITVSVDKVSEEDRLNEGTEWAAVFTFGDWAEGENLSRTYAGGWWNVWSSIFPRQQVAVRKQGDWTVSRRVAFRYYRPTPQEIELALARNDTTRTFANFQKTKDDNDNPKTLLNHADALFVMGELDEARRLAARLLGSQDVDLPAAKWLTCFYADLYPHMPGIEQPLDAAAQKKANQYAITPGQIRKVTTPRGWQPENPDRQSLVEAYQCLARVDPGDPDAHFDLALLATDLGGGASGPAVFEAVKAARTRPPASGRNYRSIIAETPTFAGSYHDNDFKRALLEVGGSPDAYLLRFLAQIKEKANR